MNKIKIRNFIWDDLDQFTDFFNQVYQYNGTPEAVTLKSMRELIKQTSIRPDLDIFLAFYDTELAGFIHVISEMAIGRTVLKKAILNQFRGYGIGLGLTFRSIERSRTIQAKLTHVQVKSNDLETQKLLAKQDFEPVMTYWKMCWDTKTMPLGFFPNIYPIRTFTSGKDEEPLTNLQNEAFKNSWGFCPNTTSEITDKINSERSNPDGIFIAFDSNQPISYCWTTIASNEFGSIGWISMTGVHPKYRLRGVGNTIISAGMSYLKSRNVSSVYLEVAENNLPARNLYLKLGFKKISETIWYEKKLI